MNIKIRQSRGPLTWLLLVLFTSFSSVSEAVIDGVTGTTFNLAARQGYISTPDGNSILTWGYALDGGLMQYPGPTMIVNQGDVVTVNLTSEIGRPVSLLFPGQQGVQVSGGSAGLLTRESGGPADTVTYTFVAGNAGTYMYHSGTQPELQTEMGLFGTLIVRPGTPGQAYEHADSAYDHEYLFLLSEMDPLVHFYVETGRENLIDNTTYHPVYWFINGRNFPDTLTDAYSPLLPHQPYNIVPRIHPGEVALMRMVVASRDMHPFHTHGNHFRLIARDGRLLQSAPGMGVDISREDFTLTSVSGATFDATWTWTGEKLGWDIYGTGAEFAHDCVDGNGDDYDDSSYEYCPDHGVPIPVLLPSLQELTFGGFYSGSPFLGASGSLPPGEGGLNIYGGMFYMWHSHNEFEIVNNDIFPGGMITMMIVEPPGVPIP